MSSYTYENMANRLHIKPSVDPKDVLLWVHEGREQTAIPIPKTDIPTVAAELLKAAGQEGMFVPKSRDEVREVRYGWLEAGDEMGFVEVHESWSPTNIRTRAANYIALAEYIESKAQRETEAAKKLQKRRENLANELSGGIYKYAHVAHSTQQAIDRIIEMEDAASRD